jgi:hypothetical protein
MTDQRTPVLLVLASRLPTLLGHRLAVLLVRLWQRDQRFDWRVS